MENLITKYALLSRRTELRVHASVDVPADKSDGRSLACDPGTLIKVFQTQTSPSSSGNNKMSLVQVLDFLRQDPIYENLYECPQSNLCKVSEELWPYVISIADPERRLRLLQNRDQSRSIIYYKLNDLVSVTGDLFGKNSLRYDCIVRYIGPVQELHPVGYFFALELLHLDNGHSPQAENIPFARKYMQCDPSLAIFTTADWISPLPTDVKKKFSALDLLSGTLEKVRTAIGPGGCTGKSPNSSFRREKKERKPEATSQFYIPSAANNPVISIDESDSKLEETLTSAEMDRKSQQIANACDTKSSPIVSTESDEFKHSIENYEKNLERQHASGVGLSNHMPAGILKHHRSSSASGSKDRSASPKPLTILSLEDRDIIVIDKADISESTKNESSVIVVDKSHQQDVDLADLLGTNWPSTAGDAASILNKNRKQHSVETQEQQRSVLGNGGSSNISSGNVQTRAERNKSPNPLSHLATSRQQDGVRGTQRARAAAETSSSVEPNATIPIGENAGEGVSTNALPAEDNVHSSPLQEVLDTGLGVGSLVEVSIPEVPGELYGVIRWIGVPPEAKSAMVGVELEDDHTDKQLLTTDGSFNGVPLFKCNEGRALFVTPERCTFDRRFTDMDGATGGKMHAYVRTDSKMFGQMECPSVAGAVPPLKILNLEELEELCGKFKGIQGHHNSCYLDATLFSMFTFTPVFDSLLFRPPEHDDIPHYANVQKVLREEIVNPLRKNMFVRADRVMKLRQLLDKLSSVSGLMSEEKDPEEFLNCLLAQIMRVEPFLKLSSGQDAYFYQLFVEKDERLSFPTVQQLFEQSFHHSDIKLKEVPSCLIIQMPRFGKNYKMYPRILPSQVLDVTDIIEDSPRQCSVCGKLAEYECRDCFGILQGGVGLESTAFCRKCLETVHMHSKRANHTSKKLSVPQDFRIMAEHMTVPRLYMELFAVVCIETSHYVAFVKAGSGPDAPWCFFDSMADRKGEQNGYNIPEMITVPDLPQWLSEDGARSVNETSTNDKMLPEHAKRLFCDAYMCMYQSTDVMMYR